MSLLIAINRHFRTVFIYMQARYYDPVIGRFYSNDPVGYTPQNPVMSFNRYMYVNNNPYKYNDPNGEFLNFAVKFVADVALNVAVQVATGQDVDLGGALKESALGIVDPTRTIKKAKKLVQALNKGCSFSAETPVLTQKGYKTIIQIEVGDFVLAKNDETGELSWREVTDTFKDWHEETITLTVVDENGVEESIVTTAEHPFYLDNTGWLEAGQLKLDDIVSGPKSENDIRITGIEINKDAQYAYNFTVDTDHTYFVGKTDIWVHNSCRFPDSKQMAKELGTTEKDFHKNIKKEIKTDLSKEVKQTGANNPDIGITGEGNIALKNVKTNKVVETDVPLDSYKKE